MRGSFGGPFRVQRLWCGTRQLRNVRDRNPSAVRNTSILAPPEASAAVGVPFFLCLRHVVKTLFL